MWYYYFHVFFVQVFIFPLVSCDNQSLWESLFLWVCVCNLSPVKAKSTEWTTALASLVGLNLIHQVPNWWKCHLSIDVSSSECARQYRIKPARAESSERIKYLFLWSVPRWPVFKRKERKGKEILNERGNCYLDRIKKLRSWRVLGYIHICGPHTPCALW